MPEEKKVDSHIIEDIFKKPNEEFGYHLEELDNHRIIFSGMYGIGKTTFLKHFFEEKKEKYNAVHLYPVNYSVATNEDIFRYIKFDILYDLVLNHKTYFEDPDFHFLDTAPSFIIQNLRKILAPLLLLIPKVGKESFKLYEEIEKLGKKFLAHYKEMRKGELTELNEFVSGELEREGSLYEDNVYTKLIENTLVKLRGFDDENKITKKENILILDDLDRIDPSHIFRLFNVFAAHFDYQKEKENKFGFDKVVFVCDIKNIREIFHNRFGASVDFTGYIDKFYSKEIFYYDVQEMVVNVLVNIINNDLKSVNDSALPSIKDRNVFLKNALKYMVNFFMKFNQINLRALLKLKKVELEPGREKNLLVTEDGRNIHNNFILMVGILEIWKSVFGDLSKLKQAITYTTERIEKSNQLMDMANPKSGELGLIENAIILLDYKNHKFNRKKLALSFNDDGIPLKFDYECSYGNGYYVAYIKRDSLSNHGAKRRVNYFTLLRKNIECLEHINYFS